MVLYIHIFLDNVDDSLLNLISSILKMLNCVRMATHGNGILCNAAIGSTLRYGKQINDLTKVVLYVGTG